jgi:hypothetical protein
VEPNVGYRVFLKITSIRGVMRFGKEGRLAYRVALPLDLIGNNSFSQDYTWTVYLSLFWLKG